MLDGQAEPPPAIQAALRRRRAGDASLGRCSKVWMRSNWMRWSIRRGTTRLTDRRPQFAALKRSLSRAEPKVRIQLPPAVSQVRTRPHGSGLIGGGVGALRSGYQDQRRHAQRVGYGSINT